MLLHAIEIREEDASESLVTRGEAKRKFITLNESADCIYTAAWHGTSIRKAVSATLLQDREKNCRSSIYPVTHCKKPVNSQLQRRTPRENTQQIFAVSCQSAGNETCTAAAAADVRLE
jgi:hypothetical protein